MAGTPLLQLVARRMRSGSLSPSLLNLVFHTGGGWRQGWVDDKVWIGYKAVSGGVAGPVHISNPMVEVMECGCYVC